MNIKILHMIEGAKEATGLAVIIDVFRAFSLECYFINNNAKTVIPVANKEIAYKLKAENPDYILAGESQEKIIDGFDYGNSPTHIENIDFTEKTIVHTTSAGVQGIVNAVNAKEIITGSLVNARAIVEYIKKSKHTTVSLVCMGLGLVELKQQEEDNLCAEYIKAILEDRTIDIEKEIENLKVTSGSKIFDKTKKNFYPEKDFYLCTQVNKFDFVLKVEKDEHGINYIKKNLVRV